jgi:hypothetical protein
VYSTLLDHYHYMVGKPKVKGHRAYTQGVRSYICGAYRWLQPIMIMDTPCLDARCVCTADSADKLQQRLPKSYPLLDSP